MDHATFVVGSYVVTFVAIGAYIGWFLRRAKNLAQHATSEDMPWT